MQIPYVFATSGDTASHKPGKDTQTHETLATGSPSLSETSSAVGQPAPQVALDVLELWVGDLDRMRHLLTTAFRFQPVDGTVNRVPDEPDEKTACLASGGVRVILRQGTSSTSPIGRHVAQHGDTVADVALVCADPGAVVERALALGLNVSGTADSPKIDLFGDRTVCHSVRETGLVASPIPALDGSHLRSIDHVAYCLPWGFADKAAHAYEEVFGLQRVDADSFEEVGDEATGMRSIVLRSGPGFTVVLTEPVSQVSTGQTRKFVDDHAGPGVQHAALAYDELFPAVESLQLSGVEFLPVPERYYDQTQQRLPDLPIPWETLRRLRILVDADDQGLLFQLFTRPITVRGTFFIELIQRSGATGFGANNVRALFAAVQATMNDHSARTVRVEDI